MSAVPAPGARPARPEGGFSFIEVIIALSILLVGSVGILTLFAIGVDHQIQRRISARVEMVRPEIETLVQQTVDGWPVGQPPPSRTVEAPLSVRGFSVRLRFEPNETRFGGPGYIAWADLLRDGNRLRTIGPFPAVRATTSARPVDPGGAAPR